MRTARISCCLMCIHQAPQHSTLGRTHCLAGSTCLLQSMPITLPGGEYWHTYVAMPQRLLRPQPILVVPLHTS